MAVLGVLAYKASRASAVPRLALSPHSGRHAPTRIRRARGGTSAPGGGGLADILGGLFGGGAGGAKPSGGLANLVPGGSGGLLGGATAGTVLTRGLGDLVQDRHKTGHRRGAQYLIARGPNQEISPDKLADALGSDTIDALSKQTV